MTTGRAGDDGTAERLRELHRLRDEGLITAEEFDAQRARILGQAFGGSEIAPSSGAPEARPDPTAMSELAAATGAPSERNAPEDAVGDHHAVTERGRFHPETFPNWLRITLIVASGLWIVTIPFMFWRKARYTWLPYVGAGTVALLVFGMVVGGGADEPMPSPTAATSSPTATATPTRTPAPTVIATRSSTATPEPSFAIANTDGIGVSVRDACDDARRVSASGDGIAEGTVVRLVAPGKGECTEWMLVRAPDGRESWVRSRYLEATVPATPQPTPTASPSPTPTLTVLDRQCLEWGRLTGHASGLTEAMVRSEYAMWQRDVLPNCRALSTSAPTLCGEMRSIGLDPFDPDILLSALVLFEVDPDQWDDIAAAVRVWCSR